MPYYRKRRMAPLKSDKHEITWSNLAQDASTVQSVIFAIAVASADKNTANECEIGSHVRSVYCEFNIAAETTTNPKVLHWEIVTRKSGETQAAPNFYYQPDRANIIKRGMEMLPRDAGTVYKRSFVVRIPRKAVRMTAQTIIELRYIVSSAESINFCGFAIYKEYY